jgi:hypothetical protein
MDIQELRVRIAEDEANTLLQERLPANAEVKDLRVQLNPDGVHVQGKYSGMLVPISFDMLWEVEVAGGEILARLARLSVAGLPAGKLRGVLLNVLADNVAGQPGVVFNQDTIHIDINAILQAQDVPVRLRPRAIRCDQGSLIFEAGQ